uniref:Hypoxia up-regulated protein 1 n=1 Tax=Meloidogyne javanica TaxID=6303 RepID=A0A915MBP8_MELJA
MTIARAWSHSTKDHFHDEWGFITVEPNGNATLMTAGNNGFTTYEVGEVTRNKMILTLKDIGRISFSRDLPVEDLRRTFIKHDDTYMEQILEMRTATHPRLGYLEHTRVGDKDFSLKFLKDASVRSAMSIDLGVEFMKMALVKPGVPMETILNRESQRKTPFALTIRNDERFFGDEALKKAISAPKQTFLFFLDLVGKPFEDPAISDYQKRFPHLVLKKNEQRGSVDFVTDAGQLPIETLLAMVLTNARAEVEAYAGNPVKDAVIAIPGFFGISERRAIEAAAKIAGINLIRLLSAGASAALNYGVFHFKDITDQPSTYLIYDVGSTKVQSTLVRLQLYNESLQIPAQETNSTETSSAETNKTAPATTTKTSGEPQPRLEVVGHGFDANLGGLHLTLKVRDYLIQQFRKQHSNLKDDIAENPQAMAKLLKEAGKVKQVLSANTETFA